MSAGFFGLLDDVAVLAKMAAASLDDVGAAAGKATAKAAGVVVDDTAVTPQYVHGVAASRELPMVKQIAIGSIRNKLLIILPVALVLSQWLPWLLTPILMMGGTYLAFEGAEKIWSRISGHGEPTVPATVISPEAEKAMVAGAVRTDLILSAEIMVIALSGVAEEPFLERLIVLVVVAFIITIAVYGVVGFLVKMDDIGLAMAQRRSRASQRVGRGLVNAMPKVLAIISVVGTVAMLWVGGHILLTGTDELGWHGPYGLVHDAEHHVEHWVEHLFGGGLAFLAGAVGWCVNTFFSAVVGLLVGAVVVLVMHVLPFGGHGAHGSHEDREDHEPTVEEDQTGDQTRGKTTDA